MPRLSDQQLANLSRNVQELIRQGQADRIDVAELEAICKAENHAHCEQSFAFFLKRLTIPSATGPQRFDECIAPFQLKCFRDMAPSLTAVRDAKMPACRRFWIERTKKASKDSDLAICLLWLIAFAKRPLYMQVGAADRDQAGIVKSRIADILHYNEWLGELVEVVRYEVRSTSGLARLDILAADIPGSHGATPDVLIINELSHVTKWEFVENLLDNADGVPQGVVIIATNAGFKGTKAEVLRRNAEDSPDWYVHKWQKPAPWLNKKDVADARRRNLPSRYNRLWWGKWASGKGDALNEEDIDRCLRQHEGPMEKPEPEWRYIAGLDLGISHDHSGLAVIGVHKVQQRIRVAETIAWEPNTRTGKVDLMEVENTCIAIHQRYKLEWLGYDEYQAVLMAQRLQRNRVPCVPVPFRGKQLDLMAGTLKEVLENGTLEAYEDDEGRLRRDFGKFSIVEKSYGLKLDAVSDEHGHADVGTALAICLPKAVQMLKQIGLSDDDWPLVASGGPEDTHEPMTDEEVDQIEDEFLKGFVECYRGLSREADRERSFGDRLDRW